MLTARTVLLTAAGLFANHLAAGQPAAPAPTASGMLFWLLGGLLGLVLLMALVTGASLASAARSPQSPAPDQSTTQAAEGVASC